MAVVEKLGPIADRLVRMAFPGEDLTDTVAKGGAYAEEYRDILNALHFIGNKKVDGYGDFRLQDLRSWERETWGAYWDIQRKFGRLESQLRSLPSYVALAKTNLGSGSSMVEDVRNRAVDQIMESLSDQAVYCIRMIQILRRLEEKGLVP